MPRHPPKTGPDMTETTDTPVLFDLADEDATKALAARLAGIARPGDVLALSGDLGSGKTVFARGFINARAQEPEDVPSPTFTLVQAYEFPAPGSAIPVFHFDLYRIEDASETRELGMDEAFATGISLIEWPERVNGHLPADRLVVTLEQGPTPDSRKATLLGLGSWGPRLEEITGGGTGHD